MSSSRIIDRSRRGGRRRRSCSLFGIPFSSSVSVDKRKRRREPAKELALPTRLLFLSTRKTHAMMIKTTRRHHHRRPHLVRHKMAMTFPLNNCFVATGRRIIDEESSSRNGRRGRTRGRKRLFTRFDDCSDDFAFRISRKSRWRNELVGIGKRAKKTSARVTVSSSSSSSWKDDYDGSTTSETTRTRTTTETTTTDMLRRLDEPVVLDWKALVRCFVKAGVASAILLRVWTTMTRGGTDAAFTAAKSQRWFLLQKWFFSSNQQSLGFGVVVGVVSFALAFAAFLVILEKERMERYRLVSAMEARDINSRFADVDGVSVHHKYFTSSSKENAEEEDDDDESHGVLFSMAHGFGANTYSYEMAFVDKLLEMENANDNNNSVGIVCHDSVGFGLTERPRTDLIKYTKVFNAKCLKAMAKKYAGKGKKKKRVVYVGHSLGTIAATLTTTLEGDGDNDTTKPAAIVLIAPAFLVKKEKEQKKNATTLDGENEEVAKKKPIPKKKIVTPDDEFYDEELFNRVVLSSLKAILGWINSSLFNLLAKPLLYVLLRTIVRSKQFWRNGLSNVVAKSKTSLVDESWIDGYRRPRMVQNWDLGMITFVSASLNDLGADLKAIFRRHMRIYADKPNEYDVSMNPMDALKKSAWEKNIPILIVHGNEDKVVPISNSVNIYNRLITAPKVEKNEMMEIPSQASSSSSSSKLQQSPPPLTKFVVMENTGHCPHEEDPETLASVVRDFLREASVM